MRPLLIIALTMVPLAVAAQSASPAADSVAETALPGVAAPMGAVPLAAADVVLSDLIFLNRAVIVFADSPNDPNFIRQMELLARDRGDLAERDAILIVDTDPAAASPARTQFRPRGFSLVLVDKDGRAMTRKPLPWELREVLAAFDKSPSRRQEVLERNPAGR